MSANLQPYPHVGGRFVQHETRQLLRAAFRAIAATLRLWRRRWRNRQELTRLDDRTLRDIGLTRGDAEFLINKPFWRE